MVIGTRYRSRYLVLYPLLKYRIMNGVLIFGGRISRLDQDNGRLA